MRRSAGLAAAGRVLRVLGVDACGGWIVGFNGFTTLAAASAARDHTDNRHRSTGNYNDRRYMSQGRDDR